MFKRPASIAAVVFAVWAGQLTAAGSIEGKVTCADLRWSAEVLARNPDIALACRGVYEKDNVFYAKATIEVIRVSGNSMTFRTLHTDGGKGPKRKMTLDANWRAKVGGREYSRSDLVPGQLLNVYLPQDRFALTVEDEQGIDDSSLIDIDQDVVTTPE